MKKALFVLFLLIIKVWALDNVEPTFSYKATGAVQALAFKDMKLYSVTSQGTIEIFDTYKKEKIKTITIPKIKDFIGDLISPKIFSIDILENKILFVSQGIKGYRNIWIYENEQLQKVLSIEKKFYVQKASFINNRKVLFALLSNQIGILNLDTKEVELLKQISHSSFSHFMISEDKKTLATTDESGIVRVLEVNSLMPKGKTKNLNLDKVYQLDYKKGKILTAGQDRKALFYDSISSYALSFDFLLYSCALNKDATLGAIAYNEENEILVFNTKTKKYLYNLKGQDATLTQILFINNNEIFASSDSKTINYWSLK